MNTLNEWAYKRWLLLENFIVVIVRDFGNKILGTFEVVELTRKQIDSGIVVGWIDPITGDSVEIVGVSNPLMGWAINNSK